MTITIRKVTGTVNALGDIDIDIQLLEGYREYTKEEKSLVFLSYYHLTCHIRM